MGIYLKSSRIYTEFTRWGVHPSIPHSEKDDELGDVADVPLITLIRCAPQVNEPA